MPQLQNFSPKRGSVIWGLNIFRSFLLTQFLEDLQRLEMHGLSTDQCTLVQESLQEIIAEFDKVPDLGFEKTIVREKLAGFLAVYKDWNEHHGNNELARMNRKAELKKLRHTKKKLSKSFARRQVMLSTDVDKQFFLELWKSLERIPSRYPSEFKRLSVAINRSRGVLKKK
jgi:hypothetical protein